MYFSQSVRMIASFITHMGEWLCHSSDRERLELCREGLIELKTNADSYDRQIQIAAFFREELLTLLAGDISDDVIFSLIEDLAVLMRERSLRRCTVTPCEKKIFEYFEQSGNWEIGDGTLVSMFYYVHVPASIERDRLFVNMVPAPQAFLSEAPESVTVRRY